MWIWNPHLPCTEFLVFKRFSQIGQNAVNKFVRQTLDNVNDKCSLVLTTCTLLHQVDVLEPWNAFWLHLASVQSNRETYWIINTFPHKLLYYSKLTSFSQSVRPPKTQGACECCSQKIVFKSQKKKIWHSGIFFLSFFFLNGWKLIIVTLRFLCLNVRKVSLVAICTVI